MDLPKRRAGVETRRIGTETVLQDSTSQQVHVVNATAAWVWERLDGSLTPDELGDGLSEAFDVTTSRARKDVADLITSFRELGLLA